MTSPLRVPFGLRLSDNVWVGPEDVDQSGLACGCICPSCNLPLKKNVCTDRADHFSHHTRQQHDKVARDCEYSFWVACATMGRQLLDKGGDLNTPQYSKTLTMQQGRQHQLHAGPSKTAKIAPASTISFSSSEVTIGEIIDQRPTDAVITVHGVRILVFLVHPERQSVNIEGISCEKAGVLAINLSELLAAYKALRGAESFKEKVHTCIFEAVSNKKWLWHPRETKVVTAAKEELKKFAQGINQNLTYNTTHIQSHWRTQPTPASASNSEQRQGLHLAGRWRNIHCVCGNTFRDFVRNDSLDSVSCLQCGLSGAENLQLIK